MKNGIELIATERTEQIEKHGRTIEKDVEQNLNGELIMGANAILQGDTEFFSLKWDMDICDHIMHKPWIEKLAIAGAFIAAEIDRLQSIKEKA